MTAGCHFLGVVVSETYKLPLFSISYSRSSGNLLAQKTPFFAGQTLGICWAFLGMTLILKAPHRAPAAPATRASGATPATRAGRGRGVCFRTRGSLGRGVGCPQTGHLAATSDEFFQDILR